ncbi:hypothetical protein EV361DRAFT_1015100 [Lentinula raphanica]|nr:hypothetical protein EV361DRAFT_1015100 [Lentinula raphanica]
MKQHLYISGDQSLPPIISARFVRRDGNGTSNSTVPQVHGLSLDANFSAVDPSKYGNVNIAIQGANYPRADVNGTLIPTSASQRRTRLASRGLTDFVGNAISSLKDLNDVNVNKTIALPPVSVDKSATLLNKDIKCGNVDITVDLGVDGKASAQDSLGVAAQGTIVPPNLADFAVTVGMDALIDGTLDLNAGVSTTFDTGKIEVVPPLGIPGLDFPGFDVKAEATAKLDLAADLKVGIVYNISNAQLVFPDKITRVEGTSMLVTLVPLTLSLTPSVKSTGSLTAHLIPSLNLGVQALDNLASATVFLDLDASATMQVSLDAVDSNSITVDNGSSSNSTSSVTSSSSTRNTTTSNTTSWHSSSFKSLTPSSPRWGGRSRVDVELSDALGTVYGKEENRAKSQDAATFLHFRSIMIGLDLLTAPNRMHCRPTYRTRSRSPSPGAALTSPMSLLPMVKRRSTGQSNLAVTAEIGAAKPIDAPVGSPVIVALDSQDVLQTAPPEDNLSMSHRRRSSPNFSFRRYQHLTFTIGAAFTIDTQTPPAPRPPRLNTPVSPQTGHTPFSNSRFANMSPRRGDPDVMRQALQLPPLVPKTHSVSEFFSVSLPTLLKVISSRDGFILGV